MKNKKRYKKAYIFIIIFIYSFSFIYTINYYINDKNSLYNLFFDNNKVFNDFVSIINNVDFKDSKSYLNNNYKIKDYTVKPVSVNIKENSNNKPLVYLYNTHQTEEYTDNNKDNIRVNPNVTITSYIIKDELLKNNINSIVMEDSISKYLKDNNLKYNSSYKASRYYLEKDYKLNKSLKYFIDLHRDSAKKNNTTININGKSYAKILFILGLENKNYQENLKTINKINNLINSKYKGLSRGIYKKKGQGVNGVYNQDFNKYTILIEVGGVDNTLEEVNNTSIVLAEVLTEFIQGEENES